MRRGAARLAGLAAAGALLAGAAAGCGGTGSASASAGRFQPATPGVLTVATAPMPHPGFWEGTAARPTGGLEYELARALARRFGLRSVQVRIRPFGRLAGGHLGGADVALALITPTDERRRVLDFSAPYLDAAPTILVRAGTAVPDLETARDLRWGAQPSTTFARIIRTAITPEQPVVPFLGRAHLLAALLTGRIDALLRDLPDAVAVAARSRGRLAVAAQLPFSEQIAVALPHGSPNVEAVSSAVRALVADGTVTRLVRRWVGPQAADAEADIPLLRTTR